MEISGIGQSANNLNAYNLNLSEYTETNTEVAVPQVQKVETQPAAENEVINQEYSKTDLDNALKKINNFLKDDNVHAEYSYHKEMKTMMIKIVDENTKEVILEIPPKKILDMVASMCKQFGLFDKKA